jgi:hypothetical protein
VGKAYLNGSPVTWQAGEIVLRTVPATLTVER